MTLRLFSLATRCGCFPSFIPCTNFLRRFRVASVVKPARVFFTCTAVYRVSVLKEFSSSCVHIMDSSAAPKPPNVLVYTGEDPAMGPCPYYESIATNLRFCLNPECYSVYLLTPKEAIRDPWTENVIALVVSGANESHCVTKEVGEKFSEYSLTRPIVIFGAKLNLPSELNVTMDEANDSGTVAVTYKEWSNVTLMRSSLKLSCANNCHIMARDGQGNPVIAMASSGSIVMSAVHLEIDPLVMKPEPETFTALNMSNADRLAILRDLLSSHLNLNCDVHSLPKHTPCYLFLKGVKNFTNDDIARKKLQSKKLNMFFVNWLQSNQVPEASDTTLPVCVNVPSESYEGHFNKELFFKNLNTKYLGHSLFATDVVGTTMDVIENLVEFHEPVVVAAIQVQGKGRGRNLWISPHGCAAFSTHFMLPLSSMLGQRLSVIQHLIGLSAVLAIRKSCGYESLDVKLKWPNDIYYGDKIKIGGVLVRSTIQGDKVIIFTGLGVNIANSKPTFCVNDAVRFHNASRGDSLPLLSVEKFIACSLNEFEKLVDDFQANGPDKFFSLYYSYWLHTNQKVMLDAQKQEVTVVGIDDYGYLLVKDENGKQMSLQPDGNSFDLLKNLICMKEC